MRIMTDTGAAHVWAFCSTFGSRFEDCGFQQSFHQFWNAARHVHSCNSSLLSLLSLLLFDRTWNVAALISLGTLHNAVWAPDVLDGGSLDPVTFSCVCRKYCARRLRRLYKAHKLTHGRGKYCKRALDVKHVTDSGCERFQCNSCPYLASHCVWLVHGFGPDCVMSNRRTSAC